MPFGAGRGSVRIGVDFDNTVVCYDGVFRTVGVSSGILRADAPATKGAIRDSLREAGREDDWTRLQGEVYGPGMARATAFSGALEFFERCRREGVDVAIVSHRTRHPYLGERRDLHEAARDWCGQVGLAALLPADRIFFEETKQAKLTRIAALGFTHFVDDLPEFLAEPDFPDDTQRILFDPHGSPAARSLPPGVWSVRSWAQLEAALLGER